ncbi:hypothetical protein RM96_17685 [Cupriavidus sp. IDO]|nr:hypothetical protein RM96_17685 [Cupriavidus sp. IDO]
MTNLLFGQERISGNELRSLLVVKMTPVGVQHFMDAIGAMPKPTVKELMAAVGAPSEALRSIDNEPDQTVAFAANLVASSFAGFEACFDFYQASAFSMAHVSATQKLAVDPVVRVEMRIGLADALLDELQRTRTGGLLSH